MPRGSAPNQPIARSTCCFSSWPTRSSRPSGNILRSKYGALLASRLTSCGRTTTEVKSLAARQSPDSLRRHKRFCRESHFEVFQPFSNGRRKLECVLSWFHAVPTRREKRVANCVAEAVQGMAHSRRSYHQ